MKKRIFPVLALITVIAMTGLCFCGCGEVKSTAVLELESNASTGYQWSAVQDYECFEITDEYIDGDSADGGKEMVGVPGIQIFTLKAVKAGDVNVTFTYSRSWEKQNKDNDELTYNFTVDKNMNVKFNNATGGLKDFDGFDIPNPKIVE